MPSPLTPPLTPPCHCGAPGPYWEGERCQCEECHAAEEAAVSLPGDDNAHLIAAAPELRDVLMEFVNALFDGPENMPYPVYEHLEAKALAVLAKAKGGPES